MNFYHLKDLVEHSTAPSHKAAIVEVNSRCVYTYADLKCLVTDLKNELYSLGVMEQMHVALVGRNTIEFITAYFAIQSINAVCIPVSDSEAEFDIDSIINSCQASYVLFCNHHDKDFSPTLSIVYKKSNIIIGKVLNNFKKTTPPEDTALFLRTSGSIINPKIVMHSHTSLLFSAFSHAEAVGYTMEERTLVVLPLCYSFAHTSQMLATLSIGGTMVLFPTENKFNVKKFIDVVQEFQITSTALMATYLKLLDSFTKRFPINFEFLQHICFAGGPTPQPIITSLSRSLKNVKLLRAYGLTEAGPRVSVVRAEKSENNVSSGSPVKGVEVQIINTVDKVGEIVVKGPNVMLGYYNDEDATNLAIKDGFLHTGDLGFLDDNGELNVVGRAKNMIISMGMKVFPEEVEEILNSYFLIKECLIKGESDEVFGEIVVAYIVLLETDVNDITKLIIDHCKEKLPTHSVPRKIFVVEDLKKTSNGKLKRTETNH